MTTTRIESVTAPSPGPDGGAQFDMHMTIPGSATGPGILLLQEIFGVNDYLKARAADLAALGYVVGCPDVFWRIERGISLPHDEAALGQAFAYVQRFDLPGSIPDLGAALAHLKGVAEVAAAGGKAGAMGFCLGGRLTWGVATHFDPETAVAYYGSGIHEALGDADRLSCPILFHYAGADAFIPTEQAEQVRAALAGRDDVEFHIHDGASHAFDNFLAPMFHQPEASAAAWAQTVDFLSRTLPV